ncbi:ABC transporter permease [Shinella granuli]|uniref:Putative spermidine/putrescine transport system permease protein n=1 Tax=Shinella granuli TaxID=323621 RepID=A0A4R2C248_SHIGR|nr:ABC transporter permease [Shinella granuli]TCN34341.1 putative spermidine/putrescine transport system permease protein [Shinella granuli]
MADAMTLKRQAARPASRARLELLALLPAVLLMVGFFIYPLIEIVRLSFTDPVFGWGNYEWFFSRSANISVSIRTFWTAALVTVICLLVSYPYAYVMSTASPRIRLVLLVVVLTPLWTSLMVRTLAWIVLLQDTGIINDFLEIIGVGRIPLIRTDVGVVIGMTQLLVPFMVLPIYSVMVKVDPRLTTAAISLGARPSTAFWRIYVPLTKSGVFAGMLTVFVLGLGFYIIPALLGSPRNTMISALIQQQVGSMLQWGRGSAIGVILLLATLLSLMIFARFARGMRLVGLGGVR